MNYHPQHSFYHWKIPLFRSRWYFYVPQSPQSLDYQSSYLILLSWALGYSTHFLLDWKKKHLMIWFDRHFHIKDIYLPGTSRLDVFPVLGIVEPGRFALLVLPALAAVDLSFIVAESTVFCLLKLVPVGGIWLWLFALAFAPVPSKPINQKLNFKSSHSLCGLFTAHSDSKLQLE